MSTVSFANEAIAGGAAGVVGTVFGYPFDVIKTRMQTSQTPLITTIRSIAQENGPKGFYIGLMSPLLALTILNTMNFTAYNYMCETFQIRGDRSEDARFLRSKFPFLQGNYAFAGAAVGPLAAVISTPFELVKTQVQLQKKLLSSSPTTPGIPLKVKGSLQMCVEIVREHGPLALFRGHVVNTIREIVFLSTYFMVYEHGKSFLLSLPIFTPSTTAEDTSHHTTPNIAVPIAGGVAGSIGWAVSFPLDNIKSQIQSLPFATSQVQRRGILEIGLALWRHKGLRGLYAGVLPSVTRSFIVSATRFSVYESVLTQLHRLERDD